MDRRIKRTRTAVFNALFDLMSEKDVDKITVLELCERADINKSTFYLHYKGMDDCLQSCFGLVEEEIISVLNDISYEEIRNNPQPFISRILSEVEKQSEYLYKLKSSSICESVINALKENLVSKIVSCNGFNEENNYCEISSIIFAVGGSIDAIIEILPDFRKDELELVICDMLKSDQII